MEALLRKILFVCYGGGHVNMLIPVIKQLQLDPRWDIHTLGLTIAAPVLKAAGIPFFGFEQLLDPDDSYTVQVGKRLAQQLMPGKVSYQESVAYLGMSYVDLEKRLGKNEARLLFKKKDRHAFLPLTVIEKLFNKLNPDLVVTTNAPRAERATLLLAKEYAIPSISLIDLFDKASITWLTESQCATKICVLNQKVKDLFMMAGRPQEDVIVTGNPAFDYLVDQDRVKNACVLRKNKNWGDKKVILWASQPELNYPLTSRKKLQYPHLPRQIDEELIKIVRARKDLHLIIRLHPAETVDYSNLPDNVVLDDRTDHFGHLLAAVDLVITMTSTVGLEAVLLDKPLITVDTSVYAPSIPYADMGLSLRVTDLKTLEKAIHQIVSGHYPCKAAPLLPQKAAMAVIDVINSFY